VPKCILIVDDNASIRKIIRTFFEGESGFDVCGEATGAFLPQRDSFGKHVYSYITQTLPATGYRKLSHDPSISVATVQSAVID
jgi:CheY-like chemotaxis protein